MVDAPRIVIAGGGPAAMEAALALRALLGERAALELIAPDRELVVRAYEVLAPFHEGRARRYPMDRVAADVGLEVVRGELARVSASEATVALRTGERRGYDALVIAVGARPIDTVKGAIPFRGAADAHRLRELLIQADTGMHGNVAFIVPSGRTWPLPLYELALNTAAWLGDRGVRGIPLTLVTPERAPLISFGARASQEVAELLGSHGVAFVSAHAIRLDAGQLLLAGGQELEVDLAVALTRLSGPGIPGLPADAEGFIPVDEHGRVAGLARVYAAGDATAFPVKQGGLATQQADAIAEHLAAELGAEVEPSGFQPLLRAVLFGGREQRYLRAELGVRLEETSEASSEPLWPGASKLVGQYLGPYLDRLEQGPPE